MTDQTAATASTDDTADVGGISGAVLKQYVERIERLEEEKKGIADDIRDAFAEIKNAGFDVKTVRQVLKLRKLQPHDRAEQEELLELYKAAIGMG